MGEVTDPADLAQMSSSDRQLLKLALRAPRAARLYLRASLTLLQVAPTLALRAFAADLCQADREVLRPRGAPSPYFDFMLESIRGGCRGPVDDYRVLGGPWGFDPENIPGTVHFWHGEEDKLVPPAHAQALAARIPGAVFHLCPSHGHMLWPAHAHEIFSAATGVGP
jgi:pimeloyl-ACP methyl ester carboxylesterase